MSEINRRAGFGVMEESWPRECKMLLHAKRRLPPTCLRTQAWISAAKYVPLNGFLAEYLSWKHLDVFEVVACYGAENHVVWVPCWFSEVYQELGLWRGLGGNYAARANNFRVFAEKFLEIIRDDDLRAYYENLALTFHLNF